MAYFLHRAAIEEVNIHPTSAFNVEEHCTAAFTNEYSETCAAVAAAAATQILRDKSPTSMERAKTKSIC